MHLAPVEHKIHSVEGSQARVDFEQTFGFEQSSDTVAPDCWSILARAVLYQQEDTFKPGWASDILVGYLMGNHPVPTPICKQV